MALERAINTSPGMTSAAAATILLDVKAIMDAITRTAAKNFTILAAAGIVLDHLAMDDRTRAHIGDEAAVPMRARDSKNQNSTCLEDTVPRFLTFKSSSNKK